LLLSDDQHRTENVLWSSEKKSTSVLDCWAPRSAPCSGCAELNEAASAAKSAPKAKAKAKAKTKSAAPQEVKAVKVGTTTITTTLAPLREDAIPSLLVLATRGVTKGCVHVSYWLARVDN
jgi:hypothetical protein